MFKKDFLWGAASAAYQVEGAWNTDGKTKSIWDIWSKIPGKTFKATNGDVATDHYHRYLEDVKIMKELGLKTYRFSISWTRILNGKERNEKGIQFYHNLIDALRSQGIEPMVTMYHWDLPQTLQDEYEGWLSPKIVDDFEYYTKVLLDEFHDKVKYWIVLNEPNIFTDLGYRLGVHPPGHIDRTDEFLLAYHHTALAHARVVNLIKNGNYNSEIKIGSSIALTPAYAQSEQEKDRIATQKYMDLNFFWFTDIYYKGEYPKWAFDYYNDKGDIKFNITEDDMRCLKEAANKVDFIGINYYQSTMIADNPYEDNVGPKMFNTDGNKRDFEETGIPGIYKNVENTNVEYTDWNWVIDPSGLTLTLNILKERYNLPIIISENGLGAFDELVDGKINDDYRIDYIQKHIDAVEIALKDGVDVLSYCVWSFTDLLSWLNGYQKRYGLVYIDFEDNLKRIKKESFYWYQALIHSKNI